MNLHKVQLTIENFNRNNKNRTFLLQPLKITIIVVKISIEYCLFTTILKNNYESCSENALLYSCRSTQLQI